MKTYPFLLAVVVAVTFSGTRAEAQTKYHPQVECDPCSPLPPLWCRSGFPFPVLKLPHFGCGLSCSACEEGYTEEPGGRVGAFGPYLLPNLLARLKARLDGLFPRRFCGDSCLPPCDVAKDGCLPPPINCGTPLFPTPLFHWNLLSRLGCVGRCFHGEPTPYELEGEVVPEIERMLPEPKPQKNEGDPFKDEPLNKDLFKDDAASTEHSPRTLPAGAVERVLPSKPKARPLRSVVVKASHDESAPRWTQSARRETGVVVQRLLYDPARQHKADAPPLRLKVTVGKRASSNTDSRCEPCLRFRTPAAKR